jgi:phage baseplate assembly protein W
MGIGASSKKEYLGQGLAFPLQISQQGGIALASGLNDIEQAIRIILSTVPGERVMRPAFGCRIHELIFAPNNATTHGLVAYYIEKALEQWEPRIEVQDVTVLMDPAQDGVLLVTIDYRPKDAHDERSIVYPFYLAGEVEPL